MTKTILSVALLALLSTLAVCHASSWQPNRTDYVRETAASSIQNDATNFLLLSEPEYSKHVADEATTEKTTGDKMQCIRRVQSYRCN